MNSVVSQSEIWVSVRQVSHVVFRYWYLGGMAILLASASACIQGKKSTSPVAPLDPGPPLLTFQSSDQGCRGFNGLSRPIAAWRTLAGASYCASSEREQVLKKPALVALLRLRRVLGRI